MAEEVLTGQTKLSARRRKKSNAQRPMCYGSRSDLVESSFSLEQIQARW
jgi:hypothetical protein